MPSVTGDSGQQTADDGVDHVVGSSEHNSL